MNSITITNIEDLRTEIRRLSFLCEEQRAALAARFKSPSALFSTVRSLFQNTGPAGQKSGHQDLLSLISRFLIPFTLNKTLFKHSNFLVKILVGVVSQKASGFVNEGSIEKVFAEGKALVNKMFHRHLQAEPAGASVSNNTTELAHEQI